MTKNEAVELEGLNLRQLVELRSSIEREMLNRKKQERLAAIEQVRELMARFDLTPGDLLQRGRGRRGQRAKVAPKYRDDSGRTWTGRGLKPRWLTEALNSGKTLESFAI